VFQVDEYRQTYQAYLDLLIRHYFNEANIAALARSWHALIKPHLYEGNGDKMYFGPSAQSAIDELDQGLEFIVELTKRRAEYVQGVLDY